MRLKPYRLPVIHACCLKYSGANYLPRNRRTDLNGGQLRKTNFRNLVTDSRR